MDVIAAIKAGKAHVEWANLVSEHKGHKLVLRVFRDALKVDGIRWPVNAKEMQQIADMTGCMLLTPKVLDLMWIEAGKSGIRFDPVINHGGKIVANLTPEVVSPLIDAKIEAHIVDNGPGKLVCSVGKYWVVCNRLVGSPKAEGGFACCNFGWHSSTGIYQAVTPGLKVWQSPGIRHSIAHKDPSQVVKLMDRYALLIRAGSTVEEEVDLHMIAKDPILSGLINHDGILKVLRQPGVPEPKPVLKDGVWVMPELYLF